MFRILFDKISPLCYGNSILFLFYFGFDIRIQKDPPPEQYGEVEGDGRWAMVWAMGVGRWFGRWAMVRAIGDGSGDGRWFGRWAMVRAMGDDSGDGKMFES